MFFHFCFLLKVWHRVKFPEERYQLFVFHVQPILFVLDSKTNKNSNQMTNTKNDNQIWIIGSRLTKLYSNISSWHGFISMDLTMKPMEFWYIQNQWSLPFSIAKAINSLSQITHSCKKMEKLLFKKNNLAHPFTCCPLLVSLYPYIYFFYFKLKVTLSFYHSQS